MGIVGIYLSLEILVPSQPDTRGWCCL